MVTIIRFSGDVIASYSHPQIIYKYISEARHVCMKEMASVSSSSQHPDRKSITLADYRLYMYCMSKSLQIPRPDFQSGNEHITGLLHIGTDHRRCTPTLMLPFQLCGLLP